MTEPKTREQIRFLGAQRGDKTVKAMTLDDMQRLALCDCQFHRCGGCGNLCRVILDCRGIVKPCDCGDTNPGA